jgi:hypothetical protein
MTAKVGAASIRLSAVRDDNDCSCAALRRRDERSGAEARIILPQDEHFWSCDKDVP